MKHTFFFRLALLTVLLTSVASAQTPLSDGKTFTGWEGNTTTQWRIEDGAFTSGSLEKKQPHNDYLATTKEFGDFELTLKWKLEGTEGFVNGGVQFRSKCVPLLYMRCISILCFRPSSSFQDERLSCSRRTWNLRGQGLAYPFPQRIPSHDPEAQAAVRPREDRHRQAIPRRTDSDLRPV